jgi:hypothetical protein
MHYPFEDADFSAYRIKKLIREGEEDVEIVLTQEKRSKQLAPSSLSTITIKMKYSGK